MKTVLPLIDLDFTRKSCSDAGGVGVVILAYSSTKSSSVEIDTLLDGPSLELDSLRVLRSVDQWTGLMSYGLEEALEKCRNFQVLNAERRMNVKVDTISVGDSTCSDRLR